MKKVILMGMMMHQIIIGVQTLSFITDFDAFVTTIIPQEEHNNFKRYYEKLLKTIDEDAPEQQCSTRRYFRQKALDSLDSQHHIWYEQITIFLHDIAYIDQMYDKDRERLQSYLLWYGAYQEFDSMKKKLKKQVEETKAEEPEKSTMLDSTKAFASNISTRVKGWFS